jgi:hypothetical protein
MTPSPHPKVQAAYERYARLLETMHRANGWGETRGSPVAPPDSASNESRKRQVPQ